MSFKEARIEALLKEQERLKQRIQKLETYIFELCDDSCPKEYKHVVQTEVFGTTDEV